MSLLANGYECVTNFNLMRCELEAGIVRFLLPEENAALEQMR